MNAMAYPDYINGIINSGSISSYVALGVLGFFLLNALIGLLFGFKRGFGKQLIRLLTSVLSVALSFLAVSMISVYITNLFAGKTLEEVILTVYPNYTAEVEESVRNIVSSFDAETARVIIMLPISAILLPIIFVICFAVIHLLSWIIYWILHSILGITGYKKGFLSALFGGILGLAQGAAIGGILLIPLAGLSTVVTDAKAVVDNSALDDEVKEEFVVMYDDYAKEIVENPLFEAINTLGGDLVYSHFSTVKVGEGKEDTRDSIVAAFEIAIDVGTLESMDFEAPDKASQDKIHGIIHKISEDECISEILSGVIRGAATASNRGAIDVSAEEPYNSLIQSLLNAFLMTDSATLESDLDTIVNVYFILADSGFISAIGDSESSSDDISDMLIKKDASELTVIDRVVNELKLNPHTRQVVDALTKLSVALLCESMGLDQDSTELYEAVSADLKTVLVINRSDYATEEEYKADVNKKLDEALKQNDIVLEEEIVAEMTSYVAENYGDKTDISDEDINDAILSYYGAYEKYLETGNAEDLPNPDELPSTEEAPAA